MENHIEDLLPFYALDALTEQRARPVGVRHANGFGRS
jgi:hypothetical protein